MSEQHREPLLAIRDLYITYTSDDQVVHAVNGLNLEIRKGETVGLVGETGAGKTTSALSILRLLPARTAHVKKGEILFRGQALRNVSEKEMRAIRGDAIAMIFQDPMTSLNPVLTVGEQIEESLRFHNKHSETKDMLDKRVDELFQLVGIPPSRKHEYPHQFSGGMKQRVVIAMALACEPLLLIADEPTTALDVTIQAQILSLMAKLKSTLDTSMLLITHDLGVVAQICDHVCVIYAGRIVEEGPVRAIFGGGHHHPYTEGLFNSIPSLSDEAERLLSIPGNMPDPMDLPPGCLFHPRCRYRMDVCCDTVPQIRSCDGLNIACHLFADGCADSAEKKQANAAYNEATGGQDIHAED